MSLPDPNKTWEVTLQLSEKLFNAVLFYHDQLYDSYFHYIKSMNTFANMVIACLMMLCNIMMLRYPIEMNGVLGKTQVRNIAVICFLISIIRPVLFSNQETDFKFASINTTTIKDFDIIKDGLHFQKDSIDSIIQSIRGMILKFSEHCSEFFCSPHTQEQLVILNRVLEQSCEMTTNLTINMMENIEHLKETITAATSHDHDLVQDALKKIAEKRAQNMIKILKKDNHAGRQLILAGRNNLMMIDPHDFIFKTEVLPSSPKKTRKDGRKMEQMEVITTINFGQEDKVMKRIEERVHHIFLELQELVIKNKEETDAYMRTARLKQQQQGRQALIQTAKMSVPALIKKLTLAQKRTAPTTLFEKFLTAIPAVAVVAGNAMIEKARNLDFISEDDATDFQLYLGQAIEHSEDLGKILGNNPTEASIASDKLLNHLMIVRSRGGKSNMNFNLGFNIVKFGRTYRKLKKLSFNPTSLTDAPLFFFIYIVILFHNKVTLRLLKIFPALLAVIIMLPLTIHTKKGLLLKKKK